MDFLIESQIKVYATIGDFPTTGATKTLYIDQSTSATYYWTGTAYSEIRAESKYEAIDVLNNTGSTQPKMAVCYLKTSSSSANTPEILLANASSEATSSKTIGLLLSSISNGSTGKLITSGEFDKFNTSAYNVGDRLWLSTTSGQMTTTPPTAPNHAVFIGIVTRKQSNNGRILISIQNGYELEELHDVTSDTYFTPQDNDSVLTLDSGIGLWKRLPIFELGVKLKQYYDAIYQAILVSGSNIKTINGEDVLGSGDIYIPAGISTNPTTGFLPYNNNGVFGDSSLQNEGGNLDKLVNQYYNSSLGQFQYNFILDQTIGQYRIGYNPDNTFKQRVGFELNIFEKSMFMHLGNEWLPIMQYEWENFRIQSTWGSASIFVNEWSLSLNHYNGPIQLYGQYGANIQSSYGYVTLDGYGISIISQNDINMFGYSFYLQNAAMFDSSTRSFSGRYYRIKDENGIEYYVPMYQ